MSILDHNSQYEIVEVEPDENAFGKMFWFSGSMKRQKKKQILAAERAEKERQRKALEAGEDEMIQPEPVTFVESAPAIDAPTWEPDEEEDFRSPSPILNGSVQPLNGSVQPLNGSIGTPPQQNGGTYFKLNGSFEVDNSDLSDDSEPPSQPQLTSEEALEEAPGGTWFGVSVRQRRAESMANLLKLMDSYQPSVDEDDIIPETQEDNFNENPDHNGTFDDSSFGAGTPVNQTYGNENNKSNGYYGDEENSFDTSNDFIDYSIPEKTYGKKNEDDFCKKNDAYYKENDDDFYKKNDAYYKENDDDFYKKNDVDNYSQPPPAATEDENSDALKLLEDFDKQFFEIEKIAMESFEELEYSLSNKKPVSTKPKKNERFCLSSIDNDYKPEPIKKQYSDGPVQKDNKIFTPDQRPGARDSMSHKPKVSEEPPIVQSKVELEEEAPPERPSKPKNYGYTPTAPSSRNFVPKWEPPKQEPVQYGYAPPQQTESRYLEDVPKQLTKDTDRYKNRIGYNSLPNRGSKGPKKSLDEHTITVRTSDSDKQEYKLGETIHLKVSVRDKKGQKTLPDQLSDEVFDSNTPEVNPPKDTRYSNRTTAHIPNKTVENKDRKQDYQKDSTRSSNKSIDKQQTTRSSRRKRDEDEPRTMAERMAKFQQNDQKSLDNTHKSPILKSKSFDNSYKAPTAKTPKTKPTKSSNTSKTKKSMSKPKLVEEDVVVEQHVADDFAPNTNDLGMDFINTYLTSSSTDELEKIEIDTQKPSSRVSNELKTSTRDTTPSKSNDMVDHRRSASMPESMTQKPSMTITQQPPRMLLKRQMHMSGSTSSLPTTDGNLSESDRNFESRSEYDSSEDEANSKLTRNRSFRRSIIIEDGEVALRRKKSIGGTSVSVAFIAINKKDGEKEGKVTTHQRLKGILNFLDNMVLDDESLGLYYDSVRQLHTIFWDLKDKKNSAAQPTAESGGESNVETLSSALNFLVVHEWPKVMLGCFKKLKAAYPHVFVEETSPEAVVYYSGHLPSLLRMNRTTSEFAVSVIFDGLLRAAINFTDVHEPSRQACCEDNLVEYLMTEIMSEMHNIKWGKATAREMFLKSISDLIYNCAQSYSNSSYLLERNCVDIFTQMRDETFHVVDARKVNMTLLLTLSYLIDDNNYDVIIPDEGSVIRVLQFLDKSLEHSEHTHHDFYAAELAGCLSRLAGHNSNKVLITRNSGQEILHKLLKYAYDDEERIAACNALWNLSFCREAKDILRGMSKLINMLRELSASSNMRLHTAAAGVIWECEDKYDIKGTREIRPASPGHVMISYESDAQPLVIKIRDELNRSGLQVWMNTEGEGRSLEDVMSKGVERASIVIVAVTRQYKLKPDTFAEIDYAHTLRKTIIPIIIDVDFVPDGWLKELVSNEQTFDFSRRSMFAGSLDALVEHVSSICTPGSLNGVTLNIENGEAKRNEDVLTWSNADVISWLKENQLIRHESPSYDGEYTSREAELHKCQNECKITPVQIGVFTLI
ncbi:uncharacterized protein [Clytia hemisphaerica]|uniref:uncharacterized protein n=1 Tax=Clytia hemisphaerica TaxID=252671 RepID=UPI0034D56B1D